MDFKFSLENKDFTEKDLIKNRKLAEEYFGTESDPEQAQITDKNANWIRKNISNYFNLIKINNEIIGFTLAIPCSKNMMKEFISRKINENQLFERAKLQTPKELANPEAIYLCSALIRKEFRKRGLTFKAFEMIIKNNLKNRKDKPRLFYWGYSEEGKNLAEKLGKELSLKVRSR